MASLNPESKWTVAVSDRGIDVTAPGGKLAAIVWPQVKGIFIQTNDSGPAGMDVFWMIAGDDYSVTFPMGACGEKEAMERFQALPGFDNDSLIAAMTCAENRVFVVWQKQ